MSDARIEAAAKAMANLDPAEPWPHAILPAIKDAMLDRSAVALAAADAVQVTA